MQCIFNTHACVSDIFAHVYWDFLYLYSSFKHLIGGLEDVSSKGHEDADAKAK